MRVRLIQVLIAVLLISIGNTSVADDRKVIRLSEPERDFVLTEMRLFLLAVQQIVSGVSTNDMQLIGKAAHEVGMHTAHQVPGSLKSKLPMEFKRLGMKTHKSFDQLALDAKQVGDKGLVLEQLSELMKNCVLCHSTYKFDLEVE